MSYSQSLKKAVAKYNAKTYEEIKLRVPKGQKEVIKGYAESNNESINSLFNRLLNEDMKKHKVKE